MQRDNGDRHINQAVWAELALSLDARGRRFVGVAVEHAVVNLSGFVESFAQKWAVERAAARVAGVKEVRNYLEVLPPRDPSREDRRIRRALKRALAWDARVPDTVHGDVTDGVLRLHGIVQRFAEREAAEEAVRNLIGVRDIANEIRVAHTPTAPDLGNNVAAALERRFNHEGERTRVLADNGVVTLRGAVSSFAMLEDIERTVRAIPGVTRIDNQLVVD